MTQKHKNRRRLSSATISFTVFIHSFGPTFACVLCVRLPLGNQRVRVDDSVYLWLLLNDYLYNVRINISSALWWAPDMFCFIFGESVGCFDRLANGVGGHFQINFFNYFAFVVCRWATRPYKWEHRQRCLNCKQKRPAGLLPSERNHLIFPQIFCSYKI